MIKRFFVFLVKPWTYELDYIPEAFRLALIQLVFWVYSFFQQPTFGLPEWARWFWVPIWVICWVGTAMSIGRFVQISGNRKNAKTVTKEQFGKIMDAYPKDEAYLLVDGRYICVRSESREMPFDSATLIRLGKNPYPKSIK
ncbi:MAG: hypothetical protein E7179_03555 [Erysipelotrichaceae bacterium]|jgi:hypothetical protein|nr:hypothetical protein [Erysipelotrichaceae bacterium]